MNKQWADFFALGSSHFGQGTPGPLSAMVPSADASSVAVGSKTQQAAAAAALCTLGRTLVTVTDVWREYSNGLGGNPSVEHIEREYGTAWRKERKESRFYSRRKELYDTIKKMADKQRTSCEEASWRLEDRRVRLGVSLDKLRVFLK